MSLMRRIVPRIVRRYLGRLRFPQLFLLTTGVFLVDLVVVDGLPFADELLLGLVSLLLASLRRKQGSADGGEAEEEQGAGGGSPGEEAGEELRGRPPDPGADSGG